VVLQVCKLSTPVIIPRCLDARRRRRVAMLLAVPLRPLPVQAPVVPLALCLHLRRPCFSCSLIMCTLRQLARETVRLALVPRATCVLRVCVLL